MSRIILILTIIFFLFSVSGCSWFCPEPKTIIKTEYEYVTPSRAWMQEYEKPKIRVNIDEDGRIETKNKELLKIIIEQAEIIDYHNQDKKYLKEWEESVPSGAIIEEREEE